MTRLGQMLEDEKLQYAQQYAQQYAKEYAQQYAKEYAQQYAKENERQVAKRMLSDGVSLDTILRYSTLLSRKDIEQILEGVNA